ncbi:MAG: lycopene cyclase domain-containing protein [Flavobacteriales bacterium]
MQPDLRMTTWTLVIILLAVSMALVKGSRLNVKAAITSTTISVAIGLALVRLVGELNLVEFNASYFGSTYLSDYPLTLILLLPIFSFGFLASYQRLSNRSHVRDMDSMAKSVVWFVIITSGIFLYYLNTFLLSTIAFAISLITFLLVFISRNQSWRAELLLSILAWMIPAMVIKVVIEHYLINDVLVWYDMEQSSGIDLLGFPLEEAYGISAFLAILVLLYNRSKSSRQALDSI